MRIMPRQKKKENQMKGVKEIAYKCIKCSYVLYKKPLESPPTFCPNCAINQLKGEMVRIERF